MTAIAISLAALVCCLVLSGIQGRWLRNHGEWLQCHDARFEDNNSSHRTIMTVVNDWTEKIIELHRRVLTLEGEITSAKFAATSPEDAIATIKGYIGEAKEKAEQLADATGYGPDFTNHEDSQS